MICHCNVKRLTTARLCVAPYADDVRMKNHSTVGDIFFSPRFKRRFHPRACLEQLTNTLRRGDEGDATKTRDSPRSAEGNLLKIQITYRNYFCPATAEDLRRGNKLAHWRRTWRHKSRRTYERPFININKPYVSVGHNDTIVARSIPRGFSRC